MRELKTFVCIAALLLTSIIPAMAFPGGGGGGPTSCTTTEKTTAGNWGGNSTCGSPAVNLGETCTFESPDPFLFQQIVDECDDYIATMGQPSIDPCQYVTVCGTFTAECDHINAFNVATYSTCGGYVESYDEFLYDASCNLLGTSTGTPATSWSGLTAGTSYIYCVEFQMLNCTVINSYLWGQHQSLPTASFTATTACLGSATTFTNQGTTGGTCTFNWDFGDGSGTSTTESPTYTYGSTGSFTVQQIICCGGCCDTTTASVTVNPIPTSSFTINTASPQCLIGNFFSFTNTGTTGGTTTYLWDYGNGNTSTGQNGSVSYGASGTYSVCLTTTVSGCSAQSCQNVTVSPAPVLTTSPTDETCTGSGDGSIDLSINGSGTCVGCSYSWVDGLGSPTASPNSQDQSGLAPDTYTVTVTDGSGCTAQTSAVVADPGIACGCTVTPGFSVSPNTQQCVETNSFTLNNTSAHSHGVGGILIEWDYDNDATIDGSGNSYGAFSYPAAGTYTARQYVIDTSVPCTLSTTRSITVTQATATTGATQEICSGDAINLFASGGTGYSWTQTSGSGSISNGTTATPTVTPAGTSPTVNIYEVTVTDANGCTDTETQTVNFNSLLVDAGNDLTVCRNDTLVIPASYTGETVLGGLGAPTTLSSSPGTVITNNNATGITDNINYGTAYTYVQEVCVDITHGSANELEIELTDPCGTTIILSNTNGTNHSADYDGTCFRDGYTAINSGGPDAPFPATYGPEQPLSTFDSACALTGNWELRVIDNVNKTSGTTYQGSLNSWQITFAEMQPAGEPLQAWTPTLGMIVSDTVQGEFKIGTPGVYTKTISVTDDNCTVTDQVNILTCTCDMHFDSTAVQIGQPGDNTFTFTLTEPFQCDSVDVTDFDIFFDYGPGGSTCGGPFSITGVTAIGCAFDSYTGEDTSSVLQFTISPAISDSCQVNIQPSATTNMTNRCESKQTSERGIILPVEFLYLTGTVVSDGISLEWVTASERNNSHFVVERSIAGAPFKEIGRVDAVGNSTEETAYDFLDKKPANGINYYRIKQVDNNGKYTYSNVINVDNSHIAVEFELINVNPIPAKDNITVLFNSPGNAPVKVEIYDMVGRRMFSHDVTRVEAGANEVEMDISSITDTGVYYLIIEQGDNRLQSKILKY